MVAGAFLVLLALGGACSPPAPQPTPRPTPTLPPTPTVVPTPVENAALLFEEEPTDVQDAFVDEVQALTDEMVQLAAADCGALAQLLQSDPTGFQRFTEFAALMRRVASNDQALAQPLVMRQIDIMDQALASLGLRLQTCNIRVP